MQQIPCRRRAIYAAMQATRELPIIGSSQYDDLPKSYHIATIENEKKPVVKRASKPRKRK